MALTNGTKLGPYEILSPAGAGGMGEVYRARDTRLGRDVAIKVLPSHLSRSTDIRARFEREAQTISQLNHPHICTLYDIGSDSGTDFLVLEFIEGETLASRLERGPIPVTDLLTIGCQIADGLAKAHLAGIVHRDLKPGNLMLTPAGVKLLDFGLSRPTEKREPNSSIDQAATANIPLTTHGTFIGTLPYMAPEQIEGKEVDARTDLFALGCILFEMATARRLFGGDNHAVIMSSIMQSAPHALDALKQQIPKPLESIIRRCLERNPNDRFTSAAELYQQLASLRDWVRDQALPELLQIIDRIQSLDEGPEAWLAFAHAREIEKLSPGDPRLERLWPEFTRDINITSDPPGASVSIQYYGDPSSEWVHLGQTPLHSVRFPRGFTRLKLELPGYRTSYDLLWIIELAVFGATDPKTRLWHYQIKKAGEIPDDMELIPGGEFSIFMPGLDHLRSEPIAPFLMDRHPVTNREFKRFIDAGGYRQNQFWKIPFVIANQQLDFKDAMAKFTDAVGQPGPASWEFGEYPAGEDNHPVTGISWFEATAFAEWAGKALPTLFHWNRVAFTVASSQIIPVSNFSGRGLQPINSTHSVGRFGIHDLAGNVREWVWNSCNREGERFILGGGWNDPEYAFTDAYAQSAFDRSATNGFRCIQPLVPDPNAENLHKQIDLPFRDFMAETPVSDELFSFFLRQFSYDKTPLDAFIESEEEKPFGTLQKICFNAAYGSEQMIAYLYLPHQRKEPLQTVVLFPGSLAIHVSSIGPNDFRRSDFLVKSGRAVLLPIYKGTYQRGDDLKSDYPDQSTFYKDHVVMWSKDLARSIDYLETRPDIDATKLAYYGLSWGGAMGAIMPAVEKRLKAVVLYVAGLNFQHALPEVDQINYVSRVTQPTLMLNGERDFYFPVETSQRPMFELLGTPPQHKRWITYSLGHSVPRNELVKEVLAWMDKYLGPTE